MMDSQSLSCDNHKDRILFQDPLNGKTVSGWKVSPTNFVDHPIHGKVCQIEAKPFVENPPWVGDETWHNHRVEIEILPSGGHWVGLDCHVQDDGSKGFNIQVFTYDSTKKVTLEAAEFMDGADNVIAWKLWPVSQKIRW
ncbi:MAG: hypothetical protein GY832_03275 [Chloroflexi bacterium]|nr:hypothetical protein [Chloroflexota bacterium]